jgi:tight adherence protein C
VEFIISFTTMIAVMLLAYGALYRQAAEDSLDVRLGGLKYQRPGREALPDPSAAFGARVLRPLVGAVSARTSAILPSTVSEKVETALLQGGLKMSVGQFAIICAVTAGIIPMVALAFLLSSGVGGRNLLMFYGVIQGLGIYGPRMWLQGRIRARKKQIWRSLPDAFDLITASVEAGLGIDAAFNRVVDKVSGPFAVELTRTLREIQIGRSRREALEELAERTGVEELRSLVNSVIQAESMGISIASVIRVQTGVMRTRRRQMAEEKAFKAPIKMVFPLVFFVFPCILIVIGGPAVIKLMNAF